MSRKGEGRPVEGSMITKAIDADGADADDADSVTRS